MLGRGIIIRNNIFEYINRNRFVPLSAMIELTYKCNFNCGFCYRAIEKRKELTKKEVFCLLDELAGFRVEPFDNIITGNPLDQITRTIEINLLESLGEDIIPPPVVSVDNEYIM